MSVLSTASQLIPRAFLPFRRLLGPLHRRRRSFDEDGNYRLPPLAEPWTDDRWFRGGFPPRGHNRLRPLVDGEEYFDDLLRNLESACERVTICGWCLTPSLLLRRGDGEPESMLTRVLKDVCGRAELYVLLWSGAPTLFEPTQRQVQSIRRQLEERVPEIHFAIDQSAPFSHDQHQKAVTIDGRIAYVGGMDLTTFAGDRWDTREHRLRYGPNWHDVQLAVEGEIVRDVEENFCQRWNAVTGERLQPLPARPPTSTAETPAQVIRTVPKGFYPFAPDGEFGIYHALSSAIRGAERLIYLENQYVWAPEIVDAVVEAMNRSRSGRLRVVLVLPARAYSGRYDNDDHVRLLKKADGGRGIFHAFSLYSGGPAVGVTGFAYRPIYVHAKVALVDDEWLCVGSANLNRRGLVTDAEMDVQAISPEAAHDLRVRLWAEHLGLPHAAVEASDPTELVDQAWPAVARKVEEAVRSGEMPPGGSVLFYRPGENPASRLLDVVQDLTLEH